MRKKDMEDQIQLIPYERYMDYSRLSAHVHQIMEHRERYVPCTENWFDELTEENSILIGIYDDKKLIAGFLALVPTPEESYSNYLESPFAFDTVIHMESVAVHEDFRGHHLEEQLILAIEPIILEKFPNRVHALSTIHPDNIASAKNAKRAGYRKIAFVPDMYDGNERDIYYKKLS